jgi:hypothetical protein
VKPVPAPLLAYMSEQSGFDVQTVRFSSGVDADRDSSTLDVTTVKLPPEVNQYLDYAIIARRR